MPLAVASWLELLPASDGVLAPLRDLLQGRARSFRFLARGAIWLLVIPFLHVLLTAYLFHQEGFNLLQGGQDELAYCGIALHMQQEMNTGSALDSPAPRMDHFLRDMTVRHLAYSKSTRHSSEVLLASLASFLQLTPEEVFPILVECSLLIFGCVVAFLGKVLLRLRLRRCLWLQGINFVPYYLVMLHVQGSLANLVSLPARMLCASLMAYALTQRSLRWACLAGFANAGVSIFYPETLFINILVPGAVLLVGLWFWQDHARLLQNTSVMVLVALAVTHVALRPSIGHTTGNLQDGFIKLGALSNQILGSNRSTDKTGTVPAMASLWPHATNFLGLTSYHDPSLENYRTSLFLQRLRGFKLLFYMLVLFLALYGFYESRRLPGLISGVVLLLWSAIVVVVAPSGDFLRFVRGMQYVMPLLFTGLVLGCIRHFEGAESRRSRWLHGSARLLAATCLLLLGVANCLTTGRTISYLATHDSTASSDVKRLSLRSPFWISLRQELDPSRQRPVTLSGFRDTVRPFLLVNAIHPLPHFVGESVYRIWPVLNPNQKPWPGDISLLLEKQYLPSRLSAKEMEQDFQKENRLWSSALAEFYEQSLQALVPHSSPYPEEWARWQDIYSPRRRQFPNMCDVVYKVEKTITLPPGSAGPVQTDTEGLYRELKNSCPISVCWRGSEQFQLKLRYNGAVGDVTILDASGRALGTAAADGNQTRLVATVDYNQSFELFLQGRPGTRIRELSWDPWEPARK